MNAKKKKEKTSKKFKKENVKEINVSNSDIDFESMPIEKIIEFRDGRREDLDEADESFSASENRTGFDAMMYLGMREILTKNLLSAEALLHLRIGQKHRENSPIKF